MFIIFIVCPLPNFFIFFALSPIDRFIALTSEWQRQTKPPPVDHSHVVVVVVEIAVVVTVDDVIVVVVVLDSGQLWVLDHLCLLRFQPW